MEQRAFDGWNTSRLLGRYREGDGAALEELFRRHYPRVERTVLVRIGPLLSKRVEVADVVQEVLLRAFQEIDAFEPREDARMIQWLARIAENEIRNLARYYRADKRDARRDRQLEDLRALGAATSLAFEPTADTTAGPEKVSRQELVQLVDECLAELPDDWREVILLRDYVGGSWAFVAKELGRPSEDAARQLHRRARAELTERVRRRS